MVVFMWLCLLGSFVHVTIGRYHEGVTGDKYNNYREIVRVCKELEQSPAASFHRLLTYLLVRSPGTIVRKGVMFYCSSLYFVFNARSLRFFG